MVARLHVVPTGLHYNKTSTTSETMKKLAVLEQSGTINDEYTKIKKSLFQTDLCDFYRLNWRYRNDPDATITAPGVLWSEGRSLLYESVPDTYDYYMFMDDDLQFSHAGNIPLDEFIINLLEEYQPISANFYCHKLWGKNQITDEMRIKKNAYPFLCLDLQLTIYSRSFANMIFPVPFHGSDRCMWYAFWLANKLAPGKQICLPEVTIKNTRSEPHYHQAVRKNSAALVKLFNRFTKDNSFIWDVVTCQERNLELFHEKVTKGSFDVSVKDVQEYTDWQNIYMKRRSPRRNLFHKLIVEPQLRLMR